jgi:putative component of membrane protein insertase Oxa1/YidC/SpoIIIJ protein YidD
MRLSPIDLLAPRIVDFVAIKAIGGYQRYLSPYKGFRCAHRVLYRSESCSQYVKRIVRQEGWEIALKRSRLRFAECKEANQILQARRLNSQIEIEDGGVEDPAVIDSDKQRDRSKTQQRDRSSQKNNSNSNCDSCGNSCNFGDCSGCDLPDFHCSGGDSHCHWPHLDCDGCGDVGSCDGCGDCGSCSN